MSHFLINKLINFNYKKKKKKILCFFFFTFFFVVEVAINL